MVEYSYIIGELNELCSSLREANAEKLLGWRFVRL
jgi:hypothetical protein